jgi:hypothetical protein
MKTTVELPAALVKEAKKMAIESDTTLRELIERGLHSVLAGQAGTLGTRPMPASLDDVGCGDWNGVPPDKYVHQLRQDWN